MSLFIIPSSVFVNIIFRFLDEISILQLIKTCKKARSLLAAYRKIKLADPYSEGRFLYLQDIDTIRFSEACSSGSIPLIQRCMDQFDDRAWQEALWDAAFAGGRAMDFEKEKEIIELVSERTPHYNLSSAYAGAAAAGKLKLMDYIGEKALKHLEWDPVDNLWIHPNLIDAQFAVRTVIYHNQLEAFKKIMKTYVVYLDQCIKEACDSLSKDIILLLIKEVRCLGSCVARACKTNNKALFAFLYEQFPQETYCVCGAALLEHFSTN